MSAPNLATVRCQLTSALHFVESMLEDTRATDNITGFRIRLEAVREAINTSLAYVDRPEAKPAVANACRSCGSEIDADRVVCTAVECGGMPLDRLLDCPDKGCQREAGHEPPHMSRYWNAQTSSEIVEEWNDGEAPQEAR